jgi:glycosyltransferase involved in cell wall biosynthesis
MIESLSYVVPTYRTGATLGAVVDRIAETAPTIARSYEVIVIDDGCPDGSGLAVAGRAGVRVFAFEDNHGQRTAVLAGMSVADASRVCVLDADLQDDPADVAALVGELERGHADVVCAGRRGDHQRLTRRSQAWVFRRVRACATRRAVPADAGLFHVADSEAVQKMLARAVPGDDPLVVYARSGARIASIPVERHPRSVGRSSYSTVGRVAMAAATARSLMASPHQRAGWPAFHEVTGAEQQ